MQRIDKKCKLLTFRRNCRVFPKMGYPPPPQVSYRNFASSKIRLALRFRPMMAKVCDEDITRLEVFFLDITQLWG